MFTQINVNSKTYVIKNSTGDKIEKKNMSCSSTKLKYLEIYMLLVRYREPWKIKKENGVYRFLLCLNINSMRRYKDKSPLRK
jgi:hypothetical protein